MQKAIVVLVCCLLILASLLGGCADANAMAAPVPIDTSAALATPAPIPVVTPTMKLTADAPTPIPTPTPTPSISLKGKICLILGDSITYQGSYIEYLENKTGLTCINGGFSGCALTRTGNQPGAYFSLPAIVDAMITNEWGNQDKYAVKIERFRKSLENIKAVDLNKVDLLLIFYGTNDIGSVKAIGDVKSLDIETITGAVNYSVKTIRAKCPNLRIVFVTPMWFTTATIADTDTYIRDGVSVPLIVSGIVDAAKHNQIPSINMQGRGIDKNNYQKYYKDGLHPNATGGKLIAETIAEDLLSIYSE